MRLTLEREFSSVWEHAQGFILRRMIRSYVPYQPVTLGQELLAPGERTCSDRWTFVSEVIRETQSSSFLDIGCAEGYFVLQAAKLLGCFALGIDADFRRLTVARMTASLNRTRNAAFIEAVIDEDLLLSMPSFDVVLFMSVLHHIMYEHGVDHAEKVLSLVRKRTAKCLIFDMGQSNEETHEWSKLLPRMEPTVESWISGLLKSAGFSTVVVAGDADAYQSNVRRHLFTAFP